MRGGLPLLRIQLVQKIFDRKGLRHARGEIRSIPLIIPLAAELGKV